MKMSSFECAQGAAADIGGGGRMSYKNDDFLKH